MSNFETAPCNTCGVDKFREDFEPYKFGKICKKCRNLRAAALRMSSMDKYVQSTISRTKARCKKTGIKFELTYQYLFDRLVEQGEKCFYTDEPLEIKRFREGADKLNSPSIDKIIPSMGYVDGNVVWCTKKANSVKSNLTLDEMQKWLPDWHRRINNYVEF